MSSAAAVITGATALGGVISMIEGITRSDELKNPGDHGSQRPETALVVRREAK